MAENVIKPMSLGSALLHFFIPAILAALNTYFVMAFFAGYGLPIFFNYIVIYATIPMFLLLMASIIAYQREGNEMSWLAFKQRFRLSQSPLATPFGTCEGACGVICKSNWLISHRGV